MRGLTSEELDCLLEEEPLPECGPHCEIAESDSFYGDNTTYLYEELVKRGLCFMTECTFMVHFRTTQLGYLFLGLYKSGILIPCGG